MDINTRASKIKLILADVDGTLTDGKVYISSTRDQTRVFSIHDGLGIYIWRNKGFKFGFITGDKTDATRERARMLKVDYLFMDSIEKTAAIEEIIKTSGLDPEEIAFVGDDLIDIPVFKRVGLAVAVADATSDLNDSIHHRTKLPGGEGAVREVIELILKAKGLWEGIVSDYYNK